MKEFITVRSLREIDALVAERVMGLVACRNPCHNKEHPKYIEGSCHAQVTSTDQGGETRLYSSNLEDSWSVVLQLREEGLLSESGILADEHLAICVAALRLRGVEIVREIDNVDD